MYEKWKHKHVITFTIIASKPSEACTFVAIANLQAFPSIFARSRETILLSFRKKISLKLLTKHYIPERYHLSRSDKYNVNLPFSAKVLLSLKILRLYIVER